LLIVPQCYFSGHRYWNHDAWVDNWQQSARLSYQPVVEVHKVTPRSKGQTLDEAILEISKYTTKPDDLIQSPEWTIELTDQIKGIKSYSVSGLFRQFIRQNELDRLESTGNLGDEQKQDGAIVRFTWNYQTKSYNLVQLGSFYYN
jgi:hypothetical protein